MGGDVSGYIFAKLTLDDFATNEIRSDNGQEYEHGMENTTIVIGRNFNMEFDFHDRENKPQERTIVFSGGFPAPEADAACGVAPILTYFDVIDVSPPNEPSVVSPAGLDSAVSAQLTIGGQDFDDQLVGEIRDGFATLSFSDDTGQGWTVAFGDVDHPHPGGSTPAPCGSLIEVERLANLDLDEDGEPDDPGRSQWKISTQGIGYIYRDRDKPNADIEFYGIVSLPFSGTVESLTQEPIPS